MTTQTQANQVSFSEVDFRILILTKGFRSARALAQKVGLVPGYVQTIARGLIPPERTRLRIAEALGVKAEEIWKPTSGQRAA